MASSAARTGEKNSDQPSYGGYDYEFLDAISSKYMCSICAKVLCDAHLTGCCGQHFCASCLTHWLDTQQGRKTCPHCRQEDFQHMANKERIRDVNELKIHCTNHKEGCGWVGELGGIRRHLESDKGCGYVVVMCTNDGCRERVSRKDLHVHLQEKCYYRVYECEYCGHKDTHRAIAGNASRSVFHVKTWHPQDHYSKCLEYPLACPNRCGVTGIRRRAMPDHLSSCPLEPVDCPFKDAGCTEKIARKDMADHMTANQQKHILQGYQEFRKSLQQMKQENQLLKDGIGTEIASLEESTRRSSNMTEPIAWSLRCMRSILLPNLGEIGDTLTFRVTDFHQLSKVKDVWQSPPFSIAHKVRVLLTVYPSGLGRGQGSHVSLSLILVDVLKKSEHLCLESSVSFAAIGQDQSVPPKTMELCTYRKGDNAPPPICICGCSASFLFPSPGEVLQSEERFLEIEKVNSLLIDDSLILELKLLQHHYHV